MLDVLECPRDSLPGRALIRELVLLRDPGISQSASTLPAIRVAQPIDQVELLVNPVDLSSSLRKPEFDVVPYQ